MTSSNSPLGIIIDAYNRAGVQHVVRTSESGYHYLFLTGTEERTKQLKEATIDYLSRIYNFMEFEPNGSIASY